MSTGVHKAYETYFRDSDGVLFETGKHVLLAELPEVDRELLLRFHPEPLRVRVVGLEEQKIVVEPMEPPS